jgi:hypothetical protein
MRRMRSPCCALTASGPRRRAAEERGELAPSHSITLVGLCEQRERHGEAKSLGGLEVDHQQELGRLQLESDCRLFSSTRDLSAKRRTPDIARFESP